MLFSANVKQLSILVVSASLVCFFAKYYSLIYAINIVFSYIIGVLLWLIFRDLNSACKFIFVTVVFFGNVLESVIVVYFLDCPTEFVIYFLSITFSSLSYAAAKVVITRNCAVKPRKYIVFVLIFATLLPQTIAFSKFPLHVAFILSRPSLEQLVADVKLGRVITTPVRAGCYIISGQKYDDVSGNVALLIRSTPGSRSGFVKLKHSEVHMGPLASLCVLESLSTEWSFQVED